MVTGPRPRACPAGASGSERFVLGVKASLWHELAIVATAALLAWLTWGAANTTALITFVVLWLMRWSAKLNIFLGVRNLHQEFWPDHLSYLGSYVGRRAANALFPLSMLAVGWTTVVLVVAEYSPDPTTYSIVAGILFGLLVLAFIANAWRRSRQVPAHPDVTDSREGIGWAIILGIGAVLAAPLGSLRVGYLTGWHVSAALVARAGGLAPYVATWLLVLALLATLPLDRKSGV